MSVLIPYTMKNVYEKEKQKLFTVISTFAGCGGSSTGYRLAGGHVLGINEFIPAAIETYKANYPNTLIIPTDIRKLTGKRICRKLNIKPGELDILDGSPPCAAFSMNGLRSKTWGREKKYSDTVQRVDDLFFEFVRILRYLKPKAFVAENVKGLIVGSSKKLLGKKTRNSLNLLEKETTIIGELINSGYNVSAKILNSADFGVPQNRERLIIVGIRTDLNKEPVFPKRTVKKKLTLREALDDLKYTDDECFPINLDTNTVKMQLKCKEGQRTCNVDPTGNGFNRGRMHGSKQHNTLLQGDAGRSFVHYELDRYPTITEGKRIQGFPDDFILTGSLSQKWERLGRSVPPLMMAAIASEIYKRILK